MLKVSRGIAAALLGLVVLPLTGCMGPYVIPLPAHTTATTPGQSSPSAAPPPNAPARNYSLAQLRSMVGHVHAIDGPPAEVIDTAQLREWMGSQALGSNQISSNPPECKDLLSTGSFLDVRIPTAAARLGPISAATILTASTDGSGLYRHAMDSLDEALKRCTPATLSSAGHRISLTMTRVTPPLHAEKLVGLVQTLSADGTTLHVLRLVAMEGNLFVTASKSLPTMQPGSEQITELTDYVNDILDHANQAPQEGTRDGDA